uniref:Serpentine receptor class gamma n=1 Tax=Panagrellus redivivus TaxID=6233 RepID=A0A7E4VEH5_PANRE
MIVTLMAPLAITGYTTFGLIRCNFLTDEETEVGCSELSLRMLIVQTSAMVVCAGICIILTTGSIVAARFNKIFSGNSTASKVERRLLLQCSVSIIFFCITIFCNYVYTSTTVINDESISKEEKRTIKIMVASSKMCVEILYVIDALMLLLLRYEPPFTTSRQ